MLHFVVVVDANSAKDDAGKRYQEAEIPSINDALLSIRKLESIGLVEQHVKQSTTNKIQLITWKW